MKSLIRWVRIVLNMIICRIRGVIKHFYPSVFIGKRLICESNVELQTYLGGYIRIGNNCELRSGCKLLTYGGNIIIGNNCSVNPYTVLYGQGNLTIGSNVRIAAQCVIIPSNHNYNDLNIPIMKQGLSKLGITIEDDVWIGCGVRILDGVVISKGCVIGAGSVVTKSTEPYGVYVGVPAKKIASRSIGI